MNNYTTGEMGPLWREWDGLSWRDLPTRITVRRLRLVVRVWTQNESSLGGVSEVSPTLRGPLKLATINSNRNRC